MGQLEKLINGEVLPFEFVIDDPSGNSHISNPYVPKEDKDLKTENYTRTVEKLIEMGYSPENAELNAMSSQSQTTERCVSS